MPEKRIAAPGFEAEDACKDPREKSAWKSSSGDGDDVIAREAADDKEEGDVSENEQLAKSSLEQTRPLPFVDETAEEEEED